MATRGLVLLAKDTFTSVTSVQLESIFSATYKQYKIIINSSGANVNGVFVEGSTPYTTGSYNRQVIEASSTTISGSRQTGGNQIGTLQGNGAITIFEILNPYQSTYTTAISYTSENPSSTITINSRVYATSVTNSFDGFKIQIGSGTITGTITVYGLAL